MKYNQAHYVNSTINKLFNFVKDQKPIEKFVESESFRLIEKSL
jgi:hypothetical protein